MNEKERCEILEHCKWVDEIICPCPWVLQVDWIKQKGIHYVAHDDLPYVSVGQGDIYYDIKAAGHFRATQRTEGISTSDVILRIIKDYDMYIGRLMERDYKAKDIGISETKAFRIKIKQKVKTFKENLKNENGAIFPMVNGVFKSLQEETDKAWYGFVKQFGGNHKLADTTDDEQANEEEEWSKLSCMGKIYKFFMNQYEITNIPTSRYNDESEESDEDDRSQKKTGQSRYINKVKKRTN